MRHTILVVLDGFGSREERDANAIRLARTPTLDHLFATYPTTTLEASGMAVGLPDAQMGNSEVGHLNLGAGRVVYQDIARIDKAIADGTFYDNAELVAAVEAARKSGGTLHLLGLTSPGGVHSSLDHAYAICELARRRGLDRVAWHAFLDGRDTPPKSAAGYLDDVQQRLGQIGVGRIASVVGRYWAMDRDNRWDRVEQAYKLLVLGEGRIEDDPAAAVRAAYERGETDEFIKPIAIRGGARLEDGDAVVFFNFRADRAREITAALVRDDFDGFPRSRRVELARYVCMTQYDVKLGLPVAFSPQSLAMILPELLAKKGIRQFRTAETEKYPHVTFFFNGGVEQPFPLEDRVLIPSNREVATYDEAPAMSAVAVCDQVVEKIEGRQYPFILVNFANPDMVGHTGVLPAAVAAVETIDACLGRIVEAARKHGDAVIITADHGNCELMVDPETGEPHTAHTTNPVPLILVDDQRRGSQLRPGGALCDVAPTLLDLMAIDRPPEITGLSLLWV